METDQSLRSLVEILLEETQDILRMSEDSIHRDIEFSSAKELINVAIGMRRTGKTYLLFQTIRELIKAGISQDQILYINLEDDRLLPMTEKQFGQLVDTFYSIYPANHSRLCYLFFDEVQNVSGWPLVVRRLLDKKQTRIFLTGSSAKLLSKEIATSLRGRSIATEVLPYSFREYLLASNLPSPKAPMGRKTLDTYLQHLENYLSQGGFPATQRLHPNEKITVLQNYVDTVVLRDIIERYGITNLILIKYLIRTLLKNCASSFSANKFHKDIKSQGMEASKDTIYLYLQYIEDAFLCFQVPIFSESIRKIAANPKKIYAIDPGLVSAYQLVERTNWGPLFENLIYLDLRRSRKEIFYYKTADGFEIDFVVKDQRGKWELLQVVWDISSRDTFERECRALRQAEKELGIKGRIIDPETYIRFGIQPADS